MFPDIFRDDVFRIESRRLWLRWPRAADAVAIAALAGAREVAEKTARIPHPYPTGAAADFVLSARARNHAGEGLSLVLSPKSRPNEAIGAIGLEPDGAGGVELGYWLGKPYWGRGLMSEAASALLDMARRVGGVGEIHAAAMVGNEASRRLLLGLGFVPLGPGVVEAPARGGSARVERFLLAEGFGDFVAPSEPAACHA